MQSNKFQVREVTKRVKNLSLLSGHTHNSENNGGACLMSKSLKQGHNTIIGEIRTIKKWNNGRRQDIDVIRRVGRCIGSRYISYTWETELREAVNYVEREHTTAEHETYRGFLNRFLFEKGHIKSDYTQPGADEPCRLNIFLLGRMSFTLRNI